MGKTSSEIYGNSTFFSSRPFKNLLPKAKQKADRVSVTRSNSVADAENIPPIDPNIQIQEPLGSESKVFAKRPQPKVINSPRTEELKSPLEPVRLTEIPDPSVKVFVRIKPDKGIAFCENSLGNVTKETLAVAGKKYAFDSVFDANSSQEEIYQRIGAPLVKDALSGYNAYIVAYGQTGSGKTYTMWGPPSSMVEGQATTGFQGIVPRVFQELFMELQKDHSNFNGKSTNFHCRCSFLEVYDEKICDLIDPTLRDLEIKDDPKNGVHVENLTEEYVSSYEDVAQILIKGLSNRKVGATSINSKSSRSHIMFTCVIESWCKESSMCFGTLRTSRIGLVDLAGFERNLSDDSTRQHVKEDKYIKKSLSKLGCLVNVLAEASQSGKSKEVPYKSSCMSHLLKESFGGNAKLSMICTVSPENKNCSETISTLRFGMRVRLMKNEPTENEIKEDEVNDLSDQIRRLKEELLLAKSSSCNSLSSSSNGYFRGNEREILNKLRLSLTRSLILSCPEKDSEEDISFTEDDVKKLKLQICNLHSSHDGSLQEESENGDNSLLYSAEGCHVVSNADVYLSCSEESEGEEIDSSEGLEMDEPDEAPKCSSFRALSIDTSSSISECSQSTDLQDPVLTESPTIKSSQKKSSELLVNHVAANSTNLDATAMQQSNQVDKNQSSLRTSRMFAGSTDTLAASLQKGLDIINSHQKNSGIASSASFSFEHLALKANTSVESSNCKRGSSDRMLGTFLCIKCQGRCSNEGKQDIQEEEELRRTCEQQAAQIENLKQTIEELSSTHADITTSRNSSNFSSIKNQKLEPISEIEPDNQSSIGGEKLDLKSSVDKAEVNFSLEEKEALLREIELLQNKLQFYTNAPTRRSSDKLRNSLLSQSMQLRKSFSAAPLNSREEFEKEREKWMEMESEWISLTDDLRIEIESNRQRAEDNELELAKEKRCTEELDDALKRSVAGHARLIEHYTELQENYNDMLVKYRSMMEWLAEVKKAACRAGATGRRGTRLAKKLTSELSAARAQREHERILLRKENQSLRIQLKDTAEAVHAAGELLARLRQAEEAASEAEEQLKFLQEDNEKMKKQIENLKQKHKMEMSTMKQYLAESRLPEAALRAPVYRDEIHHNVDDEAWRAEFGAIYQEHY